MQYTNTILVKVGEIHLKGQNRPFFEKTLIHNIKSALSDFDGIKVVILQSRIYVYNIEPKNLEKAMALLRKVFGIHGLSPARELAKDMALIAQAAVEMMKEAGITKGTFKVKARRADKRFPLESPEIAAQIGGDILRALPDLQVDVKNPQHIVEVEVREKAYVYVEDIPAVGGMPIGTNGRASLLLSGGIDSPVAGYMIAKRGVSVDCVHFHSFPHTSERAKEKVVRLAEILAEYTGRVSLFVVPFTKIQELLYSECPDELLTILMRRFMMRIAEAIAKERHCGALITGESIGQVASQTMEGLRATDNAVEMPVFRPVIGMDKLEIMQIAEKIGTYQTSILPYEDCCTVFTPRHPATHPRLEAVQAAEEALDTEGLVAEAVAGTERLDIRWGV